MPDDRRPVEVRRLEPARVGPPRRGRRPSRPSRTRSGRRTPARAGRAPPGATASAPMPSGPSSHFWAGMAYTSAPVAARSTGIAPGALRAVDDDERAAGVGELGDRARPAGRRPSPTARATATTARVRSSIAASKAARTSASSSPPAPMSTKARSMPGARRAGRTAARSRRGARGCVVTARSPGRQSIATTPMFMPSVVEWVSAMSSTSAVRTAATAARASSMRWRISSEVVDVGPAGAQLVVGELGHRRRGLGRQRARPSRCSGRCRRRARGAPPGRAASRSVVGGVGGDHGRMIPTMSGLARPEHPGHDRLARRAPRPARRPRPRRPLAARRERRRRPSRGPHPGRGPRRLADGPRRHRTRRATRSGSPRRTGSPPSPTRAGIGDGTTVVVYDDTQGLYAARVWWTLRAYGLEHVRILDGGFPAWEAEGRPVERGTGDGPPPSR